MRTLTVLLLFATGLASAQIDTQSPAKDVLYIPKTLSAGTAMSLRASAAGLDDTTQAVRVAGFSRVSFVVISSANDSLACKVAYQGSIDGVTWDPVFVLIDSLTATGNVGVTKGFDLPVGAMGYQSVRFRFYGSNAAHSANPTAKLTCYIRKKAVAKN